MTFKWARFRSSHRHGYSQWDYEEVSLDEYGGDEERALADRLSEWNYDNGDSEGIRKSQAEWIDAPPIEWLRRKADTNYTTASDLLDQRDRIISIIAKAT